MNTGEKEEEECVGRKWKILFTVNINDLNF